MIVNNKKVQNDPSQEKIKFILKLFNSKIGAIILIMSIKILKKVLFKKILTYSDKEFPDPDIIFSIKNFKKMKSK